MKALTAMQAASWVGRQSEPHLGGVAAHLYAEFDGGALDADRLRQAVEALYQVHPMLRLRINADGQQFTDGALPATLLRVDDLRAATPTECEAFLAERRRRGNTRLPDLTAAEACDISLTQLSDDRSRLHVGLDMIAGDAESFRLLVEDLARFYHQPRLAVSATENRFFHWLTQHQSSPALQQQRDRDRDWWRARLPAIAPAPPVPIQDARCQIDRLAVMLNAQQKQALTALARRQHLTLSALFLALFAATLAEGWALPRFRLNVPLFWRDDYGQKNDDIIGDFTNLLIFNAEPDPAASVVQYGQQVMAQLGDLISHAAWPGVNVMRDLSRHHGSLQFSPVVFTAGFGINGEDLWSQQVQRTFGSMNWVISQGPQVALDAQVAACDGGILINWDLRRDAWPAGSIDTLFDRYHQLLSQLAAEPARAGEPLAALLPGLGRDRAADENGCAAAGQASTAGHRADGHASTNDAQGSASGTASSTQGTHGGTASSGNAAALAQPGQVMSSADGQPDRSAAADGSTPLTPLQQAYLLGRSELWSLGGVAMHEFREYRGHADPAVLRARLEQLVAHYAALRTCIDSDRRVQYVLPQAAARLEVVDLRSLPREAALQQVTQLRETHSHNRHDPAQPPYGIVLIQLQGEPFDTVILTSFDALILDGEGISAIITRLFDDAPLVQVATAPALTPPVDAAKRLADQHYWQQLLQEVSSPSRLPWKAPLESIRRSRYRRQTLTVARDQLKALSKVGSAQKLFRNTTLSAIILDTLALWTPDGEICVGVPVAFPAAGGQLSNASTFIVAPWRRNREQTLLAQAAEFQQQLLTSLDRLAFSGVDLSRLLLNKESSAPGLPIILTNCLSWTNLPADAPVRFHDGLTQTPQVAMDIRLNLDQHKNLLLNIDYAVEALDDATIAALLAAIGERVQRLCSGQPADRAAEFLPGDHYRHNGDERQVAAYPFLAVLAGNLFSGQHDNTALICGERRYSYLQLGEAVHTALSQLQQREVQPGEVIALHLPRGPEMIISQLACALLGAIWLPIDINSPPERRDYLLENSQPRWVVSQDISGLSNGITPQQLLAPLAEHGHCPAREQLIARSRSSEPAYFLYTSGTTGKPKCVVLNNRATANVLAHTLQRWQVTAADVLISVTPPHHDMSLFDLFGALCSGATLVLPAADQEKDAIAWNRLVEQHRVSLWCSVPAILEMLLACKAPDGLASLRLIAQGGDYIKPATVATLRTLPGRPRLFSLGGPTETTIWSIWHEIGADDTAQVPYGQPLPGVQYYICNQQGEHCPPGVTGRIHTAGAGLALGYLADGVLQQHDFVSLTTPQGENVRAFKTGDEGYYRADGTIMFASRVNGYVKIRGIRVSLPEVEEALKQHPAIRDLVVVDFMAEARSEASLGLMYLTVDDQPLAQTALREFAARFLPASHIPTRLIHATALPLSSNGKTDRHQIRQQCIAAAPAAAAATPLQQVLSIYQQHIGGEQAGWDENSVFISMGLKLPQMQAIATQINQAFGRQLPTFALIKCRTPKEVVALVTE